MSGTVVLPWFTLENAEFPWQGLKGMRETLQRGGFQVLRAFDLNGQLFNELANPPPNYVRFDVVLPSGWRAVEGYDAYGRPDSGILHVLDRKGNLRVHIHREFSDDRLGLESAQVYCRYALNPPNIHTAPIERPRGYIIDVVIDRTFVEPEKPAEFIGIVHVEKRKERKFDGITDEDTRLLEEDAARDSKRRAARLPQLHPPIYRWLHDNYPDWRDPFAYW